jgi:hypothetical protein
VLKHSDQPLGLLDCQNLLHDVDVNVDVYEDDQHIAKSASFNDSGGFSNLRCDLWAIPIWNYTK